MKPSFFSNDTSNTAEKGSFFVEWSNIGFKRIHFSNAQGHFFTFRHSFFYNQTTNVIINHYYLVGDTVAIF